ncbi:hypothetical protein EVJ58_g5394 [Rhodofomes roseus]|uniref:BRCT domain-containing protein n=1 Tax=Rhodofomes roseus TaxID=34475 RepID=A0A4Y9YGJ3_9APHY|nr:hypothetical protein EVJ58_g5394 [Rhodofomes roseus]
MARPPAADDELLQINGRSARIHLYTAGFGALTKGQVDVLEDKITDYGGILVVTEKEADIIIVQYVGLELLRRKYWDSRTVWVEEPAFIEICIKSGKCEDNLQKPVRRGMGGQPTGSTRVPFTAEDDRHLAEYLASVTPNAEEGGRGGIEIYKRLVASRFVHQFDHREWVDRHTMWSWRERYNKRKHIFDPIIKQLVTENPPRQDEKGLYERSRGIIRGRHLAPNREGELEEEGDGNAAREQAEDGAVNQQAEGPAPRQRQSEPVQDPWRDNEDMDAPPRKRARHMGARQRRASSVEHARGRQQSRSPSYVAPEGAIPFEVSSAEEDDDTVERNVNRPSDSGRPGPEDAGPSGTQQSPRPSSASREQTSSPAKKARRPPVKPTSRSNQRVTQAAKPGPSQVPMSSQATLVGAASQKPRHRPAPPSTYDGPTQVAREEEEAAGPAPVAGPSRSQPRSAPSRSIADEVLWPQEPVKRRAQAHELKPAILFARKVASRAGKGKRIGVVSNSPIPDFLSEAGAPRGVSAGDAARTSKLSARNDVGVAGPSHQREAKPDSSPEEEGQGPSRRMPGRGDGEQAETNVKTQEGDEDDRDVEKMLAMSHGASMHSATSKHPFEEDLDSDDERVRRSLLPGTAANRSLDASRSFGPNTSATNRLFGSQLPMHDADLDEEASKPARRASDVQPPSAQRSSAGRPSAGRPPAILVLPAELGRTASLGSEMDSMPMPGTRARQEKLRIREQLKRTPYTPPSGTRAAQAAGILELRTRQVSRPI